MSEENKSITKSTIIELLDYSMRSISKRLVNLNLISADPFYKFQSDACSLIITTTGDYSYTLILHAEKSVVYGIAKTMKHNEDISKEDMVLYTTEFFNILCGFFVSHFNHALHLKGRFSVPSFFSTWSSADTDLPSENQWIHLTYQSSFGFLQLTSNCILLTPNTTKEN